MPKGQNGSARCGTPSGYQAHKRRGEETCRECRDAINAYSKAKRDAAKAKPKTITVEVRCPVCESGMKETTRRSTSAELVGVVTCTNRLCSRIFVLRMALTPAYPDEEGSASRCGTAAAYIAHRRRGEEACEDCKAAHSTLRNEQAKRRAA